MTDREKISHLLRRFGLGAGTIELEKYEKLGVDGTLESLLNFEKVDEQFAIDPWSVALQADGQLYRDPYQTGIWWALRMLLSQRPLQEKLTLFWHDHFAVSGEKVFEGATMLGYNEILRKNCAGKFGDLLKAVSKHGALVGYLDANTSTRIHPNENFAREMFELFTMGIGNYTEKDVKEAARAFTGWSLHYNGIGDETPYDKLAERAAREGMAMLNFCEVPALHDDGEKMILGQKGRFTGDDVLETLAGRPESARFICTKLWEFFAYEKPESAVVDGLHAAWKSSGGEIKAVLRALAKRSEFWSEKCVKTKPKSPADFSVAMFRALGLQPLVVSLFGVHSKPGEPVREELRKAGQGVFYLMSQQGMTLLFPPNVGGWEWGKAWITANNTVARVNHAPAIFWGDDKDRLIAMLVAQQLRQRGRLQSAASLVDGVLEVFDAAVGPAQRDVLVEACAKAGGPEALKDKDGTAHVLATVCKLLFAEPSFQLC